MLSTYQFDQVKKAYGSGDPESLFKGHVVTTAPWPRAGRLKSGAHHDKELIRSTLSKPPVLEDVDPRALHSTQPNILREHVSYYMGKNYEQTGRTAADPHTVGNKYPTVYVRPNDQWDILSGHHRAAVALLRGEPLRARVIRQPE